MTDWQAIFVIFLLAGIFFWLRAITGHVEAIREMLYKRYHPDDDALDVEP
jgi:hypothetical protein